jgi:hypothetical protein
MRVTRNIGIFTLLGITLLAINSYAETISGRVVNKTFERPEPGREVSLVHHGGESADVLKDTTDANGRFSFEAESAEEDGHGLLSVSYAGVGYVQDVGHAHGEPVEIGVYETSDSDSALTVVAHHLVIDGASRKVTQIVIVKNGSNRTYRTPGEHGHGLEVVLPEGVSNITGGPEGLHAHGNILVSPEPVRPGGSQLIFTHQLPDGSRFKQKVNYPTGTVDVMMTPSDSEIEATGLQDLGEVAFQQQNFRRFRGTALEKGGQIILRLGVPSTDIEEYLSKDTLKWSLGALALAFGLLAIFYRKRPSAGNSEMIESGLRDRRKTLLQQIADLDDRHEDGQLEDEDYRALREALIAEIVDLSDSDA